jgi:hypothetical protein
MIRADSIAQIERWDSAARRVQRSRSDWIRLALDAVAELGLDRIETLRKREQSP